MTYDRKSIEIIFSILVGGVELLFQNLKKVGLSVIAITNNCIFLQIIIKRSVKKILNFVF